MSFGDNDYAFTNGTGPSFDDTITGSVVTALDVEAANFEGCNAFPANSFDDSIALISRGACAFADKVNNAQAAGADAVIVYNNRDATARISMAGLESTTIRQL